MSRPVVESIVQAVVTQPAVVQAVLVNDGARPTSKENSVSTEDDLISILAKRELRGLKQIMKRLRALKLSKKSKESVTNILVAWLSDCDVSDFMSVFRHANIWSSEEHCQERARKLTTIFLTRSNQPGFLNDEERQKAMKSFLSKAIKSGVPVQNIWTEILRTQKRNLTAPEPIQWVSAWSKTGDLEAKRQWERFVKEFVPDRIITSKSTTQTNESLFHLKNEPLKKISSVVIWNGNGVRARWNTPKNELRQVVHAANPDVLFF